MEEVNFNFKGYGGITIKYSAVDGSVSNDLKE